MGLNNWLGTFSKADSLELSSDLEQAYEAALMIQGLELEYFNDRPVRTNVDLGLPKATQAQIFRRFRSALIVCRQLLGSIERRRNELDQQELRQLQLIESVVRLTCSDALQLCSQPSLGLWPAACWGRRESGATDNAGRAGR